MRKSPKNWRELTISIKEQSNWTCYKCGRSCLRPKVTMLSLVHIVYKFIIGTEILKITELKIWCVFVLAVISVITEAEGVIFLLVSYHCLMVICINSWNIL